MEEWITITHGLSTRQIVFTGVAWGQNFRGKWSGVHSPTEAIDILSKENTFMVLK